MRRLAVEELSRNIKANENHPSVMLWSIGNELSSQPGPGAGRLHQRGGQVRARRWTRRARSGSRSPPTRARSARRRSTSRSTCSASTTTSAGTRARAARSSTARSSRGYLDAARACYPDKALMITEFGAEANRDGPVEEKGTWAFQQEWINYQLGVFATKPWLSGAIYWALNEFWVRPGWEGGNPRPTSPIHQKGLITYDGVRKPAWADVQRWYTHDPAVRSAGHAADVRAARRGAPARSACASARGGGPGRRACRDRSAGACRTGRRTAAGSRPTGEVLGLSRDAVVAAAAGVVLIVGGPRGRAVGTKEHQEQRAAKDEGHEMENAEDHEQLRVGGHCSMNTRRGRAPDSMFATMLGRSSRRVPLPAATTRSWPNPRSSP